MRILVVVISLAVVLATSVTSAGEAPGWVLKAQAAKSYLVHWTDGDVIYGIGMVPGRMNPSLQRATADNRARAALREAVGLSEATIRFSEIIDHWQLEDGTLYALARAERSNIKPAR